MTVKDARWVGWVLDSTVARLEEWVDRHGMSTTAMDLALQDEARYGTLLHAVAPGQDQRVGTLQEEGEGVEGRAACGVTIPAGQPWTVRWFYGEESGARKCRRCRRALET